MILCLADKIALRARPFTQKVRGKRSERPVEVAVLVVDAVTVVAINDAEAAT